MTLAFGAMFALFIIVTMPLRSSPEVRRFRFDPVRIVRGMFILSGVIWLLPITEAPPFVAWHWGLTYFLSATISLAALAWGTSVRVRLFSGGLPASSVTTLLVVMAIPFAAYYAATSLSADLQTAIYESQRDRRLSMWEGFGVEGDRILLALGFLAYPAAHLWAVMSPRHVRFWVSLLLLALFVVQTTATGGRMVLMFSAVVVLLLWHTRFDLSPTKMVRSRFFTSIALGAVVAFIAYYMFYYVMAERIPTMAMQYGRISKLVVGAYPQEWMLDLNDATNGAAGAIALNLGYFSSPINYYHLFMERPCCEGQGGVYNFPFLASFADISWFSIREDIAAYWTRRGYSPNPWATAYRDWFIDFGLIGSFIFNAIVFATMGLILRAAASSSGRIAGLVAAYATAMLIVMPLQSPLLIQVISGPFYVMLAMFALVRAPGRSARATRTPALV